MQRAAMIYLASGGGSGDPDKAQSGVFSMIDV
jgi:hypothetical protein